MVHTDSLPIRRERIQKLIVALSCASYERFDAPEACIDADESDEFGLLEGILQLFIDELAVAKANVERTLEESEAARAELERQLRTINAQRQTISDLSAPVIDLWNGVLTLPLVGTLDERRAVEITERVLSRVVESSARCVLVDLTGIEEIDTATADHLGKLARGLAMLGSRCIFTGIRPAVAQTLVTLGIEMGGIQTMQTLEDGLRACMAEEEADASLSL